jgi:hypothetical protein
VSRRWLKPSDVTDENFRVVIIRKDSEIIALKSENAVRTRSIDRLARIAFTAVELFRDWPNFRKTVESLIE